MARKKTKKFMVVYQVYAKSRMTDPESVNEPLYRFYDVNSKKAARKKFEAEESSLEKKMDIDGIGDDVGWYGQHLRIKEIVEVKT